MILRRCGVENNRHAGTFSEGELVIHGLTVVHDTVGRTISQHKSEAALLGSFAAL